MSSLIWCCPLFGAILVAADDKVVYALRSVPCSARYIPDTQLKNPYIHYYNNSIRRPIILVKKTDKQKKNAPPTIENRKARHDFHIDETYEAGLALRGTEVKSIRGGKASLNEAFAYLSEGEIWLKNMYIKPYEFGSFYNHDERRDRKLLLKKKEIREIDKHINQKGFTLVPLKLYFKGGYAKIMVGLARGKKQYDKREDIKEKDVRRELDRKVKGTYSVNL